MSVAIVIALVTFGAVRSLKMSQRRLDEANCHTNLRAFAENHSLEPDRDLMEQKVRNDLSSLRPDPCAGQNFKIFYSTPKRGFVLQLNGTEEFVRPGSP